MEKPKAATYYHKGVVDLQKQQERMIKISKEFSCLTIAHAHPHSVSCQPKLGCYFYKNGELVT